MEQWHHFNPTRSKFSMLTSFDLLPEFETLQTTSYIDVDGTRSEKKAKTRKEKESKICFELLPACDLHGCDIT